MPEVMTIGRAAVLLGIEEWKLRRLFTEGLVPEPQRLGMARILTRASLPALKRALAERFPTAPVIA